MSVFKTNMVRIKTETIKEVVEDVKLPDTRGVVCRPLAKVFMYRKVKGGKDCCYGFYRCENRQYKREIEI